MEFTKGDGALWTSLYGNTTNAQSFNIDVAGKTTIELNVGTSTDGNYFDHADWIDMYLNGESCSNPMPTNVVANPPT
ncbi:MAG: NPCBM/NEW2 domain-containing protein [Cytophagaceae bacterium]|nr:NPCBM/NEW2 domain-containing protein [Cytophagaceae bacterium]